MRAWGRRRVHHMRRRRRGDEGASSWQCLSKFVDFVYLEFNPGAYGVKKRPEATLSTRFRPRFTEQLVRRYKRVLRK
jgi:hypothetical protein